MSEFSLLCDVNNWHMVYIELLMPLLMLVISSCVCRCTYQPGTVEANSHLSETGFTARPAGQR